MQRDKVIRFGLWARDGFSQGKHPTGSVLLTGQGEGLYFCRGVFTEGGSISACLPVCLTFIGSDLHAHSSIYMGLTSAKRPTWWKELEDWLIAHYACVLNNGVVTLLYLVTGGRNDQASR